MIYMYKYIFFFTPVDSTSNDKEKEINKFDSKLKYI